MDGHISIFVLCFNKPVGESGGLVCFCCCFEGVGLDWRVFQPRVSSRYERKKIPQDPGFFVRWLERKDIGSCRMDTITITGKRSVFSPLFILNRTTEEHGVVLASLEPSVWPSWPSHWIHLTHTLTNTPTTTTPGLFIYKQMFHVLFLLSRKESWFLFLSRCF